MAHANPEFALGLMRPSKGPVSHQIQTTRPFSALRAQIDAIALKPAADRTKGEQRALDAWIAFKRRTRGHEPVWVEEPGGMHAGGKIGERFVEPKRRYPANVQAGRPDKPRRSVLPR
jgi:hypothetical protein